MKVKATINRLVDKPDSSIKAVASASFDGYYAVHGIKVCKGEKGLFVSMPSVSYTGQNEEKKYQDIFHPVTKGAREALYTAVIGAYKQAIEMSHKEGVEVQDTPEDESEDMSDDEEPAVTGATEAVSAKEEKTSQTTTGAVTVQPSEVTTAAIGSDTAAVTTATQSKPTTSDTTSAETTTADKPKATTSAKKTDMTKSSVSTTRPEQQKPDAAASTQSTATETTRKKLMTEIYTAEEMDKIADEFIREELKYVNIERAKGNTTIIKHTDNGDTQIETPEVGAEFEIYLKSAGSFESAKETEKDYLTTDENGCAQSKDMPYGVYVVHQAKGADGAEKIADFEVVITENERTYRYIINNKAFESYVRIVKANAETGKTIPYAGAEFEIYDSEGNKVSMTVTYPTLQVIDTFCTDSTGSLVTPDVLPYGDYTLVEVTAPYGYVADSTPVPFTVSEETAQTEQEIRIVRVVKSDMAQKGRITVSKTGLVFSSVTKQDNMYTPVFDKGNLAGAVFEIRAAEDVVTADGTVRLKKGDVAATLTTDRNGFAESGELYLGKYTVTELTAPFGYVLNTEIKTVELVYAGQEAAVADTAGTEFFNAYQSIKVHLKKIMEHDDLFNVGGKSDAKNVTFGLFAAEEITAADGNKIPANGLVQVVSVGEDMTAEFNAKIPFGKYYVQEISTDEKYVISGEKYLVAFEYAGQDTQTVDIDCGTFENVLKRGSLHGKKLDENGELLANAVFGIFHADCENFVADNAIATSTSDENGSFAFENIPYGKYIVAEIAAPTGYVFSDKKYDVFIDEDGDAVEITAENKPITIKISKRDVYGKELAGAQMQLIDSEGNTVDEWISDGTDHVVTKLPVGKYTLREVASPEGYVISTDIVFEIDIFNVVTVENVEALSVDENGIPTITMVDDTTTVSISKQDITSGKELAGATLQIIDENGEVVEEWTSSDTPHYIEGKLIAGKTYTLHEEIAPDGYVVATDIQFTVSEDGTVTEVVMKDERIPEKPKTPDDHTPKTGEDMPCGSLLIALVCASAMIIIRKIQRKEDVNEN